MAVDGEPAVVVRLLSGVGSGDPDGLVVSGAPDAVRRFDTLTGRGEPAARGSRQVSSATGTGTAAPAPDRGGRSDQGRWVPDSSVSIAAADQNTSTGRSTT